MVSLLETFPHLSLLHRFPPQACIFYILRDTKRLATRGTIGSGSLFRDNPLKLPPRPSSLWLSSDLTVALPWLTIGDCSCGSGTCSPAPTRKGQWGARSGTQGPRPQIGSPTGNQACIVPRLLWSLLLLKLSHPGLRQQLFTAYLLSNFLKSVLNLPIMECNQFNHFSPWSATSFSFK